MRPANLSFLEKVVERKEVLPSGGVSLENIRYKGFARPSLAREAGPTFLDSSRKVAKEDDSRGGPAAPLLRISPYPAGLRAVQPSSGLSSNRRCDLLRTKAAADGGWRGLPFRPAVKRHFRYAPYARGGRNVQFCCPLIVEI